jgi:hypothetical protein
MIDNVDLLHNATKSVFLCVAPVLASSRTSSTLWCCAPWAPSTKSDFAGSEKDLNTTANISEQKTQSANTDANTSTLDALLHSAVNEHPFTISGGAIIIGVTILKIIKKLKGK